MYVYLLSDNMGNPPQVFSHDRHAKRAVERECGPVRWKEISIKRQVATDAKLSWITHTIDFVKVQD